MIGQLRGRLADKRPNQVMVDVGGVGYLVAVPLSTFAALGELHTEVTLLVHTHVLDVPATHLGSSGPPSVRRPERLFGEGERRWSLIGSSGRTSLR